MRDPLDGARQLREMQDAKMRFGMPCRIVIEGARDGFRSDQAEVVQIIGSGGVGIIAVQHASREFGAVSRDAVKAVLIRAFIEIGDECAVLLF